jgi:hypothetical protein
VCDEITARRLRTGAGDGRKPGSPPRGETAVKDFDGTVSSIGQEPPKARGRLRVRSIVGDDQRIVAYTDTPHRLLEDGNRRERVTTTDAWRAGQLRLQIHPYCARNVAGFEIRLTRRTT